jgi:RNA polymerase sigma factor (sigma-70 family)
MANQRHSEATTSPPGNVMGVRELSDQDLFDRWCAGDARSGVALFERHYPSIYRFFEGKVSRDVGDPAQETFLACVRQRHRFRRSCSFRTFLFAIARNELHAHWRRLRRQETHVNFDQISLESLSTTAGTRLARHEDRSRMLAALEQLPLDQQLLLELHYWEKLEASDLAVVFNVRPATIRGRLFRARAALRDQLCSSEARGTSSFGDADFDAWVHSLPALPTYAEEAEHAPPSDRDDTEDPGSGRTR